MLRSNLSVYSDAYNVVKGTITVTDPENMHMIKNQTFKIMHLLLVAF